MEVVHNLSSDQLILLTLHLKRRPVSRVVLFLWWQEITAEYRLLAIEGYARGFRAALDALLSTGLADLTQDEGIEAVRLSPAGETAVNEIINQYPRQTAALQEFVK